MIVVPVMLASAIDGSITVRAIVVIDNISGRINGRSTYRCRAYRKPADGRMPDFNRLLRSTPIREGRVEDHASEAEPIGNLVAKAFAALGYAS